MKAFLDIETGGFSTTKNGICEIALVVVDDNFKVVDVFHELIKPYTRLNEDGTESVELVSYKDDAMAVNGLTVERLVNEGLDVVEVSIKLSGFIDKHNIQTVIGHNSNAFDIPRVEYLLNRFVSGYSIQNKRKVDTMVLAKDKLKLSSYKLEFLCAHFGIQIMDQHTAKGDALATFELYKILIF
ncbi:MAG: 3'-5' exonuclease [Methylotenera sp.]|nr:3'-5' exonuclease [Flavobacterium sp.]